MILGSFTAHNTGINDVFPKALIALISHKCKHCC